MIKNKPPNPFSFSISPAKVYNRYSHPTEFSQRELLIMYRTFFVTGKLPIDIKHKRTPMDNQDAFSAVYMASMCEWKDIDIAVLIDKIERYSVWKNILKKMFSHSTTLFSNKK